MLTQNLAEIKELLSRVEAFVAENTASVNLESNDLVIYGDIHGEPEAALEVLADAKAGKKVVVLGDLAYRSACWPNQHGQMLETLLILFEAMVGYNAVLIQGNCDSRIYGLMPALIIDEVYPELITGMQDQQEFAERVCKIIDLLPVMACSPQAMMVHGCPTGSRIPVEKTWSVFDPKEESVGVYERFGYPSFVVGWEVVAKELGERTTLFVGHEKKPGVKERGFQIDRQGDKQVICLMSSSQAGSVGRPVKCLFNGSHAIFVPLKNY